MATGGQSRLLQGPRRDVLGSCFGVPGDHQAGGRLLEIFILEALGVHRKH